MGKMLDCAYCGGYPGFVDDDELGTHIECTECGFCPPQFVETQEEATDDWNWLQKAVMTQARADLNELNKKLNGVNLETM